MSPLTSEWVRYLVAFNGGRLKQESLHPSYFGQLALGRCLAMMSGNVNLRRAACWNRPGMDAAGMYLLPAPTGLPNDLPHGWTRCAGEGGTCTFTGTRLVGYGAGQYRYQVATGSVRCVRPSFGGDPAYGVLKSCYVAPEGGPAGATACATEGGTCAITTPTMVAYGANGSFVSRLLTAGATCGVATFGSDPLLGIVKSCYLAPPGAPSPRWTSCAAESGACSTAGKGTLVAYGARGSFVTRRVTGSISCTPAAFGTDPISGVVKSCYVRTGGPSGYATKCGNPTKDCAFAGQRTVAYGAAGDYVFKTFDNGPIKCNLKTFGADPRYGVEKSCYLTP